MRRIYIFALASVVFASLPASATIINIPDDYLTIQQGIDASTDGDTVLVQPGTYMENINFNGHNIVLGSLFLTTGDTAYITETIIDGDWLHSVIIFESVEDNTAVVCGFTIQNGFAWYNGGGGIYCESASPTVKNCLIDSCYSFENGGGIYCESANPTVKHCLINSCAAIVNGGGIYCENSSILVESCMIKENRAGDLPATTGTSGGGICCVDDYGSIIRNNIMLDNHSYTFSWTFGVSSGGGIYLSGNSNSQIINNLICSNSANCATEWYAHSFGGGIFCSASGAIIRNNTIVDNSVFSIGGYESEATGGGFSGQGSVINTIIWGNTAFENPNVSGSPFITYSCIEGGWEGEGNIDTDPLFRAPENGDFHLMSIACGDTFDSPCIDVGHPDILDSLLDCSWGLGGLRSDMGAYGGGDSVTVGIDYDDIPTPDKFSLCQNYPNPFNAMTVIRYSLAEPSDVTINIYDILGRKVKTLIDKKQQAGYHQAIWNAGDRSPGIYLYRIKTAYHTETRKMVFLK